MAFYFQLKPQEVDGIGKDFEEPGHLAPTGLYLGGTKYMVIQGEPGAVIRGKKVIGPYVVHTHPPLKVSFSQKTNSILVKT